MAEAGIPEQTLPQKGKVRQVSQKWRVYEDGVLADGMQKDEFYQKKDFNVNDRRIARVDRPTAKLVQSEEEERLQKEQLAHLERQKIIASYDAEVARKLQQEEHKPLEDERTKEDAIVASQVQTAEMIEAERERIRMEMQDQMLAARMQQHEKEKAGLQKQERSVAKTRKALQKEQSEQSGEAGMRGVRMQGAEREEVSQGFRDLRVEEATDPNKVLRTDGRLEDEGDFNDFYIQPTDDMDHNEQKELQELQDEELARLLQDQEKKRGAAVDKHKLKEIEERDAEIARLIHEQEKLKKAKRDKAKQLKREGRGISEGEGEPQVTRHVYRHETRTQEHRSERGGHVHTTRVEEHRTVENGREHVNRREHTHTERVGSGQQPPRELPPYRHPPPIHASPHREGSRHSQRQHSYDGTRDSPPYERPPLPPQHGNHNYTEYAGRPLPDTPSAGYETHIQRAETQQNPPHSPVYSQPNRQRQSVGARENGSTNVFAALDPTFHGNGGSRGPPPRHQAPPHSSQRSPSDRHQVTRAQGALGPAEDPYSDLNDVPPIQNQKRTSGDKKKNSCKQQ